MNKAMNGKKTLHYYLNAKEFICAKGYFYEAFFQDHLSIDQITLDYYYREYAWVVLSSGLSEKVVRRVFGPLEDIFMHWTNVACISANSESLKNRSLQIFNNKKKIDAIISMGVHLSNSSIENEILNIKKSGIDYLSKFKFLGPATSYHFAKNIGLNLAKPDRHLVRIANKLGYSCPHSLCDYISDNMGEKKSVVDIILWRYATLNQNYLLDE